MAALRHATDHDAFPAAGPNSPRRPPLGQKRLPERALGSEWEKWALAVASTSAHPGHASVTYDDLERVDRGVYRLATD
ncbi:hypothetical protein PV646_21530 [Streptomyces sp. ID05-26A]|nr:hypothetical protein [Streptomyces sp. ID05-26A]